MRRHFYQGNIYPVLLLRLLIALIIFSISRSLFYFFNFQYFGDLSSTELLIAFLGGIRFDITAVIILNAPYLLMNVIPLPVRTNKTWQRIAITFYIVLNILGVSLNAIDTVYFRFTSKRMTADIFSFIKTGEEDIVSLIPRFIVDFAWEVVMTFILFAFFIWLSLRVRVIHKSIKSSLRYYLLNTFYFCLAGALAVIGIRGGFQLRPITIIDAGKYASAHNISLVLNTPFSIIKTYGHTGLKEKEYFQDESTLEKIFSPVHKPRSSDSTYAFKPYNVVVIIMESFSTEYIASLNGVNGGSAYTPHLDSIVNNSLSFRAYANGKQSMEALPAIVAGLPSLTTRPYITSAYGSNHINSLASLLGKHGYSSAFYHGGRNGTMGFESFTEVAGFHHYFGKDEYGNDDDFDGHWGIYDGPYFEYFKRNLDTMQPPFMATLFSLSSHHPYMVPEKHEGKFNKGTLDIHESIMYADYALGKFFREAARTPWFDSTLFVITADHTSLSYESEYKNREGIYAVPIIFYMPAQGISEKKDDIAQQTDIMPSVLGFLDYPVSFIAFGNNLFESTSDRYSVSYLDGSYQLMKDGWSLLFDGDRVTSLMPLTLLNSGSRMIPLEEANEQLEPFLKAYIQQYNHRLIHNQLTIKKPYE